MPTGSGDYPCVKVGVPNGVMPPAIYRLAEPWGVSYTQGACCYNTDWLGWDLTWIGSDPYPSAMAMYTVAAGGRVRSDATVTRFPPILQFILADDPDPIKNLGQPPIMRELCW